MSSDLMNGRHVFVAMVAGAALMAWSSSGLAQVSCTISNWTSASGLTDANTGAPSANNRRYAGPCGLRVPVNGVQRYLTDSSPDGESTFNARFYAFLDNAGQGEIILFSADDGTTDQVQVVYNTPIPGALSLRVFDSANPPQSHLLTFENVGGGWHSIEFAWEAAAAASIAFSVNGAADSTMTRNTAGIALANSNLGNVGGANTNGTIDFDDFDSRRTSRPGRLLTGDANGDNAINIFDIVALRNEILGRSLASAQPDCNEDGAVNVFDIVCLRRNILNLN